MRRPQAGSCIAGGVRRVAPNKCVQDSCSSTVPFAELTRRLCFGGIRVGCLRDCWVLGRLRA